MESWLLLAIATLACLQASAQPPTQPISGMVAKVQARFGPECASVRAALATAGPDDALLLAAKKDLSCDCIPQALDAAFPAAGRSGPITQAGFSSRMSGPFEVCMARTMRTQMGVACAKGQDPFAGPGEKSSPARTAARCTCARAELSKRADVNLAAASKESAARYDAQVAATAAGKSAPAAAAPTSVVDGVVNTCGSLP